MKFNWQLINDNIPQSDKDVLIEFLQQNGVKLTQGSKVKEFEKVWSEWLGVKHSVYVNSGANANLIMVATLKELTGKKEVIVPTIGWVSDISPLVNLGLIPVFSEIDSKTMSMSLETIKAAVTDDTAAIVYVHALGFNGFDDEILDYLESKKIILIEDCCESHGALHNGEKVGTFGLMSNFSFYFGHHITTIEGGMVCTNDDNVYELLKMYRSHGLTREASQEVREKYEIKYPNLNPLFTFAVPGFNCRNTELNAVIGIAQMSRIDYNIQKRHENLLMWIKGLSSDKFWTDYKLKGNSSFALPLILVDSSLEKFEQVCQLLIEEKVEFRVGTAGGGSQVEQPYLMGGKYNFKISGKLPVTNHIHKYGLYIGNHTDLIENQITELTKKLNKLWN